MSQDLVVTFGKSNGKEHDWTYQDLDPSLSAPEIKEACELLTTLDIFEQDGVKLFDSVVTAKVLIHKERLIFDPENDCAPEAVQPPCFDVKSEPTKKGLPKRAFTHPLEDTDASIKVEKDALPPVKIKQPVVQMDEEQPKQAPEIDPTAKSDVTSAKEGNRLLRWIHRVRSRNKEDPTNN